MIPLPTPDTKAGHLLAGCAACVLVWTGLAIAATPPAAAAAGTGAGTGAGAIANPSIRVPLVPGLVITGAVEESTGDREPILAVTAVRDDSYDVRLTDVAIENGRSRPLTVLRTVRHTDQLEARTTRSLFFEGDPVVFPGSTPFFSRAVLMDLRRGGASIVDQAADSLFGLPLDRTFRGTLRRVGHETLTVILNGTPTAMPVIHARGELVDAADGRKRLADVFVLDDPGNPIFLRWSEADYTTRIVRIDFPDGDAATRRLDAALSRRERVDIYSVSFDFASARIRPESKPTLDAIATVLARHPDWKLLVDGHTDNIGGDAANLELSKRRALAVRDRLVADYRIDANRLATAGSGKGGAIASNETPEGRARNRRVALSRL